MAVSDVVSAVKKFIGNLPNIRKEIVGGLAAAGALIAVLQSVAPHTPDSVVAVLSATGALITAAVVFLSNPEVIQLLTDVAGAVTPKALKKVLKR